MKDAADLKTKAKDRRRSRRENSYKDADRFNFRNEQAYKRHEATEMADEKTVEMQAYDIGKKRS